VVLRTKGAECLQVRHVGDKRRDFHQIVECCIGCSERQLQIFEDLSGLRHKVVFTDDISGLIEGNLSGDVNGSTALNFDNMRVARRGGQSWRIHISNICAAHSSSPLNAFTALYVYEDLGCPSTRPK